MSTSWLYCGLGLFFCISGLYVFYKNAFDESKNLKWVWFLLIAGVVLLLIGTAKYLGLMK